MKTLKMNKNIITTSGITLLSGAILVGLNSCSNNYSGATVIQNSATYYPYDYYYYPYWSVYFHISTGYYYYYDGTIWVKTRTLPSRFLLDSNDRVRIVINSDRPYIAQEQHKVKYTPLPQFRPDKKRDIIERRNNIIRFKKYRTR